MKNSHEDSFGLGKMKPCRVIAKFTAGKLSEKAGLPKKAGMRGINAI